MKFIGGFGVRKNVATCILNQCCKSDVEWEGLMNESRENVICREKGTIEIPIKILTKQIVTEFGRDIGKFFRYRFLLQKV